MEKTCTILGAGNLATRVGTELKRKGYTIRQVYSRTEKSAKNLSDQLEASFTSNPRELKANVDFFLVALKDDAVGKVLPEINFGNKLLIHCSGSLPVSVLKGYSENYGVLYPLQTFSKSKDVNFFEIPIFIEANSGEALEQIKTIALDLSQDVKLANSHERLVLHIAAVFACNFVNHMYVLSESVLKENGFGFDILKPLVKETANKVKILAPEDAQTGPAVRFDQEVIDKHLKALSDNKELAGLYKSISESIFAFHQKKG